MSDPVYNKIRGKLIEKGSNVKAWAKEKGFSPEATKVVLYRYCGRNYRPSGPKSKEIIEAIEAETGVRVCG